jgi:Transglycosylase SLT domain
MKLRNGIRIIMGGAGIYVGAAMVLHNFDRILPYLPKQIQYVDRKVEVPVPVEATPEPVDEVVNDLSQVHQVPVLLARAIIRQESGANRTNDAVRFEPRLEAKYHSKENTASYGLFQVIPVFAKGICNLTSWSDLVGPKNVRENVNCGLKMLRKCYERQQGSESHKWKRSLVCFNGGEVYADQVMAKIGQLVLEGKEA